MVNILLTFSALREFETFFVGNSTKYERENEAVDMANNNDKLLYIKSFVNTYLRNFIVHSLALC